MEVTPGPLERRIVGGLVKTLMMRGRRKAPAAAPDHLASRDLSFEGNTGATLAGRWFPAETPRGAVVLAHPDKRAGKHWFVSSGWVDFLHANGYDVLTFDFPGYGGSQGPATYYHEDVLAAAELAREWSGFLPVHVAGVSMGAFAVANASPKLTFVKSITLESPYPSFNSWYDGGDRGAMRKVMDGFDRAFPASSRAIQADLNIARAAPQRILVALSEQDRVTPPALSERIFAAAPADRARLVRVEGDHFAPIRDKRFQDALLETLG